MKQQLKGSATGRYWLFFSNQYLESSGHHSADRKVPLFMPLRGKLTGAGITANGIYTVVTAYAKKAGLRSTGSECMDSEQPQPPMPWSMKPTSKVQAWLGHANISTTKIYDRRENRPEDSPTYKVKY